MSLRAELAARGETHGARADLSAAGGAPGSLVRARVLTLTLTLTLILTSTLTLTLSLFQTTLTLSLNSGPQP